MSRKLSRRELLGTIAIPAVFGVSLDKDGDGEILDDLLGESESDVEFPDLYLADDAADAQTINPDTVPSYVFIKSGPYSGIHLIKEDGKVYLEDTEQLTGGPEIRDTEANASDYDPEDGIQYVATDTGRQAIGNGDSWDWIGSTGDTPTFSKADIGKLTGSLDANSKDITNAAKVEASEIVDGAGTSHSGELEDASHDHSGETIKPSTLNVDEVGSDLIPDADGSHDLGSSSASWATISGDQYQFGGSNLFNSNDFIDIQPLQPDTASEQTFTATDFTTVDNGNGYFDLTDIPSAATAYINFITRIANDTSNETTTVRVRLLDSGGTSTDLSETEISVTSTSYTFKSLGWTEITSVNSDDFYGPVLRGKVSSGTGKVRTQETGYLVGWRL